MERRKTVIAASVLMTVLVAYAAVSCTQKPGPDTSSECEVSDSSPYEAGTVTDLADEGETEQQDPVQNSEAASTDVTEPLEETEKEPDTTSPTTEESETEKETSRETPEIPTEAEPIVLPKDWF